MRSHLSRISCVLSAAIFALAALTIGVRAQEIPILIPQRHPVIDVITDGVSKELSRSGYKTVLMDAQGVPSNIPAIIDAAIQKHPPVIVSISTGLSQTAAGKIRNRIPLVFGGVTAPIRSQLVADLLSHASANVTGTSDVWPISDQLKLLKRIVPEARSVCVAYRPSEANSQAGMELIRKVTPGLGLELVERGVEDPRDLLGVVNAMLSSSSCSALFIGPDNLTIEGAKTIIDAAMQARKPVFGGEPGTLEKGAVGIVEVDYKRLGEETGRLAARVIGGEKASAMPVVVSDQGTVALNYDAAKILQLSIPDDVRASATRTIGVYAPPQAASPHSPGMRWVLILAALVTLVVLWRLFRIFQSKTV
jgi:ABC-type uncharacterized transport system substrate-binding protein